MNDQDPDHVGDDEAPLAGVRVVELSMYVQGPVGGLTLAALGAEVIKIEQVDHADHMRNISGTFGVRYDEQGQLWQYNSLNRGKRSLALDVTTEDGREVFHRLLGTADVFLTNLRTTGLERLGASPEVLHEVNPQLVYARGGGFALHGDLAEAPCQDTVGMAYAGFMDLTSPTEAPNYPPGSMSDVLTGTAISSAVMAGLLKRARTGKGCTVGTSQTQALLWMTQQSVGLASSTGQRMSRYDQAHPSSPLFNAYETADGWIAIAAIHPNQWPRMARALEADHLIEDPRFATFVDILQNAEEFTPLLSEVLRQRTTAQWWPLLRAADVWSAPVNRIEDLATEPGIVDNEYLVEFPDGFVGPPAPFEVDGYRGHRGVGAEYGEHTDEVLASLGYDEDRIIELRVGGTIW